jgi:hypothetical protein
MGECTEFSSGFGNLADLRPFSDASCLAVPRASAEPRPRTSKNI